MLSLSSSEELNSDMSKVAVLQCVSLSKFCCCCRSAVTRLDQIARSIMANQWMLSVRLTRRCEI